MSDSTRLIKRYYHSIKSVNLRSLVDQVDNIASLLSNLFESDFLAVYYKKYGNDNLVPLGYNNNGNINSPDIQKIEKEYCFQNDKIENLVPGLLAIADSNDSTANDFAKENNLNYVYQFPHQIDENVTIMVVAYWYNQPNYDEEKLKKSVLSVFDLLHNILNSIDEHKKVNDYTIRLSDIISMFEIDILKFNYDDLVKVLVNKLYEIVPAGYLIFTEDEKKNCDFKGTVNLKKVSDTIISKLELELKKFSSELDELPQPNGIWADYPGQLDERLKKVLISPICTNKKKKTFLIYTSDQKQSLTDNDKQLLSLYSLFSSIILDASILLESELRMNKLLKKTSSQLADIETLAALTDLTTGVAHEFNNMIGGIVGRVQLLKLNVQEKDFLEKLDKIEMIAQDGAETVRRIQEFSTGAKYKKTKQFDLVSIFNKFEDLRNFKWFEKLKINNIEIKVKTEIHNAYIQGISNDVSLALDNIVENAVEHATPNSSVLIMLDETNTHYEISVHNFGEKIKESELKRVFYPFFSKKDSYGAGMGLSIVHGIVTRHGGKITVTSSDQSGTTFKIEFLKIDAVEDESDISRKIKTVKQLKILVVDDDDQIREVLTDMLMIDGYETIACEDGPSALKAFAVNEFDLVITDLGMPGMSGLELSEEIHSQKPNLPIAMITGWGTQLNHDEVALKGIKSVMSKPFHLKEIKAMITELVGVSSS